MSPEPIAQFLERHWAELMSGEVVWADSGAVEDPGDRFEWFDGSGEPNPLGRRRYFMRLRDGSRIRADVSHTRVRFSRQRADPRAGLVSALRYAWTDSALARGARALVGRGARAAL